MKTFLFAIITFNRSKFLEVNLLSLIKEIKKFNLENDVGFFIGDDKSVDNTLKILNNFKNQYKNIDFNFYFNKKNLGLPANTFKIIEKSPKNYQYIWLLSDDDFLKENYLKNIINYLKKYQPDILYLNYQLVNTFLRDKKPSFKKIDSVIGPGIKLNENKLLENKKQFFNFLSSIGFFNIRMILAQQSIPIVKNSILKNNLKLLKKTNYDLKKESYPFDLCLYYNFPDKILFLKNNVINITTNNRSWNYDILKANEVVRNYFNPLQKMILKKYNKYMPIKLKFLLNLSILYSNLIPFIIKASYLIGFKKKLYQIQFGKENEKN